MSAAAIGTVRKRKSSPTRQEIPAHQRKRSRPTTQPPPPTPKTLCVVVIPIESDERDLYTPQHNLKAMAFFGLRKWSTPVLKPLWPFMFAGATTMYLVAKAQDSGVKSAEWRNDPRNPYAAQLAKESLH